jgi:hypothetical protein
LYGAWRGEAFHRTERLQPYSNYLPSREPEKVETIEDRLAQIKARRFGDSAPTITRIE